MIKDVVGGLILLAVAVGYYWLAEAIPRSTLADAVGPSGVPEAFALILGGLATLLVSKAALAGLRAHGQGAMSRPKIDPGLLRSILRMLGMLGLGIAYLLVLPWLGYFITLALLLLAVIVYQGQRFSWQVVLTALIGAGAFWLIFVLVLGIPLPAGILATSL